MSKNWKMSKNVKNHFFFLKKNQKFKYSKNDKKRQEMTKKRQQSQHMSKKSKNSKSHSRIWKLNDLKNLKIQKSFFDRFSLFYPSSSSSFSHHFTFFEIFFYVFFFFFFLFFLFSSFFRDHNPEEGSFWSKGRPLFPPPPPGRPKIWFLKFENFFREKCLKCDFVLKSTLVVDNDRQCQSLSLDQVHHLSLSSDADAHSVNGSRKRFTAYDTQSYYFIMAAWWLVT